MYKSKVLYSAIIKKRRLTNNNTTRITLPKDAILLSGLNTDFFEVHAYSDRIEIRPHEFKFIDKPKEILNDLDDERINSIEIS